MIDSQAPTPAKPPAAKVVLLELHRITADVEVSARAVRPPETVHEYAEAMRGGAEFPPAVVFFDGERYFLSDGFLRVLAAKQAGLKGLRCEVRPGSRRAALLHAASCNRKHGLRRSQQDTRLAVLHILTDEEGRTWANIRVAEHVGVCPAFVKGLRDRLASQPAAPLQELAEKTVVPHNPNRAPKHSQTAATVYAAPTAKPAPPPRNADTGPARAAARAAARAHHRPWPERRLAGPLRGVHGRAAPPALRRPRDPSHPGASPAAAAPRRRARRGGPRPARGALPAGVAQGHPLLGGVGDDAARGA